MIAAAISSKTVYVLSAQLASISETINAESSLQPAAISTSISRFAVDAIQGTLLTT